MDNESTSEDTRTNDELRERLKQLTWQLVYVSYTQPPDDIADSPAWSRRVSHLANECAALINTLEERGPDYLARQTSEPVLIMRLDTVNLIVTAYRLDAGDVDWDSLFALEREIIDARRFTQR